MKFQSENLLYLCLFALIPWIVYLFQIFSLSRYKLPSLIFIQEASKRKITSKKRFLIYLLQSLALFTVGIAAASPHFPKEEKKYFCIVDDLTRTQWNHDKWKDVQSEINDICSHKFYSLTSLAQNRFETVSENLKPRNEIVYLKKTLLYWLDEIISHKILLILPEKNYTGGLESLGEKEIAVYPVPLEDKENRYFEKVNLSLHPFDYRKRELYVRGNMPYSKNAQIVIERAEHKTSVSLDENAELRMLFDIDFSKEKETLRIYIQGDSFYSDNEAYVLMVKEGPYSYETLPGGMPVTVKSIIELDRKKFPFQWFQDEKSGKKIRMGHAKEYQFQKDSVYFTTGALKKGHRFLEAPVGAISDIWSKKFIQETYDIAKTDEASNVLERFTDGSSAVLKYLNGSGGLFLFNPDSAEEELQKSIAYPVRLLKIILNLISEEMIITAHTETERNLLFHDMREKAFAPQVLERKEKNVVSANVILKRHPMASYITEKDYPDSLIFQKNKDIKKDYLRMFFLSLFLLLLMTVFWLDKKHIDK